MDTSICHEEDSIVLPLSIRAIYYTIIYNIFLMLTLVPLSFVEIWHLNRPKIECGIIFMKRGSRLNEACILFVAIVFYYKIVTPSRIVTRFPLPCTLLVKSQGDSTPVRKQCLRALAKDFSLEVVARMQIRIQPLDPERIVISSIRRTLDINRHVNRWRNRRKHRALMQNTILRKGHFFFVSFFSKHARFVRMRT